MKLGASYRTVCCGVFLSILALIVFVWYVERNHKAQENNDITTVRFLLTTKVGNGLQVDTIYLLCETKAAETLLYMRRKRIAAYDRERLGVSTETVL